MCVGGVTFKITERTSSDWDVCVCVWGGGGGGTVTRKEGTS